jgi:hypothetical protein
MPAHVGWSRTSDMPARCIHLAGKDADDFLLAAARIHAKPIPPKHASPVILGGMNLKVPEELMVKAREEGDRRGISKAALFGIAALESIERAHARRALGEAEA